MGKENKEDGFAALQIYGVCPLCLSYHFIPHDITTNKYNLCAANMEENKTLDTDSSANSTFEQYPLTFESYRIDLIWWDSFL